MVFFFKFYLFFIFILSAPKFNFLFDRGVNSRVVELLNRLVVDQELNAVVSSVLPSFTVGEIMLAAFENFIFSEVEDLRDDNLLQLSISLLSLQDLASSYTPLSQHSLLVHSCELSFDFVVVPNEVVLLWPDSKEVGHVPVSDGDDLKLF